MKRAAAFLALVAAAAAILAGGAAYMSSVPQDYALEAEAVSGGAEAARGVTLCERAIVGGHLVWELEQDAASGAREVESYWSPSLVTGDPEHDGYTVEYGPSLGFELQSLSRNFVWKPGHLPRDLTGPYLEIFNALLAEYGGGLPEDIDVDYEAVYPAGDYFTHIPVEVYGYDTAFKGRGVERVDWSDAFHVALPEGAELEAVTSMSRSVNGEPVEYTFSVTQRWESEGGHEDRVNSVNAVSEESSILAGGYFYFTLDVYDELGAAELETDFPGGHGVWRVRAEEDSAPWWSDDDYSVTADLGSVELAFSGWDWDDALLDASADGKYVLLYTLEGAELWLNVLDPNSGAAVQRLELTAGMPEDEREALEDYGIDALNLRQYASDGGTVFFIRALRDWAVAADYSDGRYAPEFTAEIDMYAADLSLFTAWPADCAWDGERLCTLYAQRNLLPWETGADKRGYALVVQREDGAEYVGIYNRPGSGAGYGGTCELGFAGE